MSFHQELPKLIASAGKGFFSKGREAAGTAVPIVAIGALGLLTVAVSQPAWAVTSVQPFTTTDTFTITSPASPVQATYYSPLPQFTVLPFNTALGTLTSTTIAWATTASFSGTVGAAEGGGGAGFSFGGSYFVDGAPYAGNGSGGGDGGTTGSTLSINIASYGSTYQFLSSDAGIYYDPNILAAFIGLNPYPITYSQGGNNSPYSFSYSNIASGTGSGSVTTTASVTYDYVAAPSASVPGPLPLLGVGAAWGWSRRLRRRCAQRQG
jgi:hypothetical protein